MLNLERKIRKNFQGIYKACGNKFWFTCGSYLMDGQKYKYDKRMLGKQILLYKLAKENSKILEVGVYMGHSMLIMLTSNPKLKITGLEIDNRYAPKAVNYLKKKFSNSKVDLILGDSIENLKKIKSGYDLYHIDGDHRPIKIFKEIYACIKLHKKKKIKILFDDVDMMTGVEKILFSSFKIKKFIKPKSRFRNLYVEMELNRNSIKKFKNSFLYFSLKYFIITLIPFYIKRLLILILKSFIGKKNLNELGDFIQNKFKLKIFKSLGKKLKNI